MVLPNVDTQMDEDGWAIVIRAIRHLALVQAGGANDLNNGAVDANQVALSEFADALSALRAEADPFPQYQLAADATGAAVAFKAVDATTYSSLTYPTTLKPTAQFDTDSAYSVGTGVYTVPSTGYYTLMFACQVEVITSAGGNEDFIFGIQSNGSFISGAGGDNTFRLKTYAATGIIGHALPVFITAIARLTAGDAIKVVGGLNSSGSLTSYSVAGITFSISKIG